MASASRQLRAYRGIIVCTLATLLLAAMAGVAPGHVRAAYSCNEGGLNQAVAAGGNSTFTCTTATTDSITGTKVFGVDSGIDGANAFRVFTVNSYLKVLLANLTVANGQGAGASGIYKSGTLTVTNSTISAKECSILRTTSKCPCWGGDVVPVFPTGASGDVRP